MEKKIIEVHLEPVSYVIRAYTEEDGFNKMKPYVFVGNLYIINRYTGYLHAMHGEMDKNLRDLMQEEFKKLGLEKILTTRHGKERVYDVERGL